MKPITSFLKACALAAICVGFAAARGVAAAPQQKPATGPFGTTGKAVIKTQDGKVIPLKREEQIAFMFVSAINDLEHNCDFGAATEPCTLEALIRGPKSKHASSPIGKLKFDPNATDPNYTYKVVLEDGEWKIWANPRKPGLGGFYQEFIGTWYNPAARPPRRTLRSARPKLTWISGCDASADVRGFRAWQRCD